MKKAASIFLVCMLLFASFVGCSKQGDAGKEEKGTSAAEVKPAALSGKIEFFQQKREVVDIWDSIITEFNKEYPDVVTCIPDYII